MNQKILYVDDDLYETLGYVEKLQAVGYEVTTAAEPTDALELLMDGSRPDIIIADLIMRTSAEEALDHAHAAGVRFCQVVREKLKLECPILVLSVLSTPQIQASLRPYTKLFFNKLLPPNQLVRHVREALG
jgi:CheY-like chemotaxis protein